MGEIIRVTDPATIRAQVIASVNDPNNTLIEKRESTAQFNVYSGGTSDINEQIPKDTTRIIVVYVKDA